MFKLRSNGLRDSIVVECWHRVQEVWSSIPSQGPRYTKDDIKTVLVVPLVSTGHLKRGKLALTKDLNRTNTSNV